MSELKPVNCGCGGEAKVYDNEVRHEFGISHYVVECRKCGIITKWKNTEAEAVQAWNKAMGAGKDDIAITKGTWMMTFDGFHCSVCFYKCETTALPDVCPHCGTKMEG